MHTRIEMHEGWSHNDSQGEFWFWVISSLFFIKLLNLFLIIIFLSSSCCAFLVTHRTGFQSLPSTISGPIDISFSNVEFGSVYRKHRDIVSRLRVFAAIEIPLLTSSQCIALLQHVPRTSHVPQLQPTNLGLSGRSANA